MLYRPAISQSDCKKPGPYQLPSNNGLVIPSIVRRSKAVFWLFLLYLSRDSKFSVHDTVYIYVRSDYIVGYIVVSASFN